MGVWRLELVGGFGRRHDAFVDAEPSTRVDELAAALEDEGFPAHPLGLRGRVLDGDETLAGAQLEHGAVLTCGSSGEPERAPRPGRHLVVVAGPDAGRNVALVEGTAVTIGRTGDLALRDPYLSVHHCTVEHRDGCLHLDDAGSTNGTFLEGERVDGSAELPPGAHVQAGSSVLTVVDVAADDVGVLGYRGPDHVFPRQFRTALAGLPRQVEAPRANEVDGVDGRMTWWRGLLPLVTGAGMALMTGRWIFLLIMAISPVVITFDALGRKRRTREEEGRRRAEHERALEEFRARVVELRRTERARRRDAATCGGVAVLGAAMRHRRLWERSPADADFLAVAVGLAALPSAVQAADPDEVLDPLQWGTPLETNLLATGSLAVVGEVRRARAVARGLVMSLAATHSPTELRVWVLTADDGRDWGFARWLPHTFDGEQGSLIAADDHTRAMAVKSIKQLLDTRAELDSSERPLPVHLVVVDGTELLAPGELADLLGAGPALGVVGMTIDGRLAPEGIGATLTVTPASDGNVFESRHQPRTEGVIVPEVDTALAAEAARRLASLRPMRHDEHVGLDSTVHLVDLVDGATGEMWTGADVGRRWAERSPDTTAVVGTASDTTMVVDLVRDGPHGLVGGTSGSGKTELLKTLFVSLCLNNHPDDLAIVIVDFKGGVDHDAVRPIPHVVDVATNLDPEQFKRTIVMLKAESRRRQDLLAAAGTSNLDAYRIARARDPHLPPVPRLLVVVDEFGELLASEGGREQLKELESITRIGRALGINLLLVTQNFEGNLPSQIDANAGLRVCLRVQKPAHSKAVLASSVASTIPDRCVGRAYARFHGRDLIEFQTARVAGRRRDLTPTGAAVDVRVVPFEALAAPPPDRRPEDVPAEETDMHTLVAAIREAATATGWRPGAVPWPATLPEHVSVAALAEHHHGDGVPIGLVDLPDEQRRAISAIGDHDEQVALVGGPNAPLAEVLTTYGASLALLRPPGDVHVYGIDLVGRSMAQLADLPHCGGVAVRNEALALRILRWMIDAAAERKIAMASTSSSDVWEHAAATGEALPPQLVLLVSGADRLLMSADGPASNLVGPLTTLLSEAGGVRIQVVLAGLPRVVTNRLGMNIERRFVFQLPDPNEYSPVGARKSVAADLEVPRRVFEVPAKRIVQLAELAGPGRPDGLVVQQLAGRLPVSTDRPPRRFADVPWPQPWEQAPLGQLVAPDGLFSPLAVGIDVRSGEWAWIDALDDGPVFAVAGPPKSGRSAALAALARMGARSGWSVLDVTVSRRSPLARWDDPAVTAHVAPDEVAAALERTPGHVVVLVDDLQRLTTYDPLEAALEQRDRVLIVVTGPADFLGSRLGVLRPFPMAGAGLLLAPTGALDGGAVGLRRLAPELVTSPRPGRGVLAVAGEPTDIQVPFVRLP